MAVHASKMWHIRFAAQIMRQGGVIAYPTETVWGLGCDPENHGAVQRLLEIKQRPEAKGLILITGQVESIQPILSPLPESLQKRFLAKPDVPTTWLVPDQLNLLPTYVKGAFSSAAIRLTSFPIVVELTKAFGGPIVSTSANRAGQPPAKSILKLQQTFGSELDYILPASLGGFEKPSTIKDLQSDKILRV